MVIGNSARNFSLKFGQTAGDIYRKWRGVEKKIKEFDRYYTGGLAGDLYRMTPAYGFIEPIRNTTKTLFKASEKIGTGIGENKMGKVLSGFSPLIDVLDEGGQQKILSNVVYNPMVQQLYKSPYVQSKLY